MNGVPALFRRMSASPDERSRRVGPEPLPERVDVAVVGGGVVGLSVGWRLAARGLGVALFDAGEPGGGTSSAATGMLAAAAEHEAGGEALLALGLASQRLWPAFRDGLVAAARQSIDYRRDGTLVVAVGRDEVDRLRARQELQGRAGLVTRWLNGSAVRALEPGLRPTISAGIACPDDHQVDPRLLLDALQRAFVEAGGRLFPHRCVEALERIGGAVSGVVVDGRVCSAGTTVLATGAAIARGCLVPEQLKLPVRPLKGQAMALRHRQGRLPIEHVVWSSDVHLAPKSDGRLILGATVEEAGFDPAITAGGVLALLDGGRRVLPGIEEMAIEDVWTGFRPTSDDDGPILGPTGIDGLLVAAGHHRNGYLLAPVTAQAIEDLLTRGQITGEARRFGAARFATTGLAMSGDTP